MTVSGEPLCFTQTRVYHSCDKKGFVTYQHRVRLFFARQNRCQYKIKTLTNRSPVFRVITIYSSCCKLHVLCLRSLTPVTYLCRCPGIHSLVAFLQLELFRVYKKLFILCALEGSNDFSFSGFSVFPTFNFHPLAFFEVFVVLEEVSDLRFQ